MLIIRAYNLLSFILSFRRFCNSYIKKSSVPRGTLPCYLTLAGVRYLPNFMRSTLMSAGDTPGMREA